MATAVFECARTSVSESCSVKIIGEHDDVVQAAHDHLVSHGLTEGDELKKKGTTAVEEHQTKYGVWGH